ncbi:formate dehydrogenase accessory protein FdhE [Desulfolutivibrio sulfoxidireducens]|uniref:formate dehydrogenase accessory protein FdhE n=1 Tax=Desulfolutivibrio sulfoxidireducens TaxID=2773299 RepID=UPI00159E6AF0|nr:formate dehydrogenase accessory protein FdhE [Desulfolutivibrio sulfoxidireducens]QLA15513.1 formate dehydrogenase accessory protein FdhE [Desulfolutivibrio sulfoxidireducens]QLA19111.1 formate dehydrogenase accessory protein FdhE [Desulfolutivibrio sulfoxidireducens]
MTRDCPSGSDEARTILADASRLGREIPSLVSLLDSFTPLLVEQAAIRESAPGWTGDGPGFDPELFCQGKHLLAETGFQDVSAQIPDAARRLFPIMARCFSALGEEIGALLQALSSGALSPEALTDAAFAPDGTALAGISPEIVGFAAREVVRPFVKRQAADLLPLVKDLPWRRTVCPICGGPPHFSRLLRIRDDSEYITGQGGPRFLRCAVCATEWRHKRVSCPRCGNEEPTRLSFLYTEARPFERVDVCEACKTSILCLDATEMIDVPDPDVSALAMLPLEILARDRGYHPFAAHPWSPIPDGPPED